MPRYSMLLRLAGASVLLLATAPAADAHHVAPPPQRLVNGSPPSDPACRDAYRDVKRQGRSCRVDGHLWKVKLHDGSTVLTHGADPAGAADAPATTLGFIHQLSTAVQPRQPVCADTNRFRALIAVPSDVAIDVTADEFRNQIELADGTFYHAAVESGAGGGAHFRFACDTSGRVSVTVVTLPHTLAESSFASITGDLAAAGYANAGEKYAVYFDGRMAGMCGQGTLHRDPRPGTENVSNYGKDYAIAYHCSDNETLTHEMSHNLGAVQNDAPHSSGGGHCLQSLDIMCYADGGATDTRQMTPDCTDFDHLDCGHDDYFDARLGVGQGVTANSWLGSHWNVAGCANMFIANTACDLTAPTVSAPTQKLELGGHADSDGSVPVRLSWSGSDSGGSGLAAYTLYQSTDNAAWVRLALPSDLTTTIVRQLAPGHDYAFLVGALDGNGNASQWGIAQTFRTEGYQDTNSLIAWSTGWTRSTWTSASGGTQATASAAGSVAQLTFTGRDVAWITTKAANRGQADVWIDGARLERSDLQSDVVDARVVKFSRPLPYGTHTIKIVVTGTPGRPWVDVDEFAFLR